MRIVVMGTGPFAVPTFRWLVNSEHSIPALVTRPVPVARGKRATPVNPMRDLACEVGLRVLEPESVNDEAFRPDLETLNGDLFVVCDYGQILSRAVLELAPLGGINLHASLLPRYRGAAPINWALYDGQSETGVSVIQMSPRMDAGRCLVRRSVSIDPGENAGQLEHRLSELGVAAVGEAIAMLAAWDGQSPLGQLQDEFQSSRAPRLKKRDGRIDWRRTGVEIVNQLRAFHAWPTSFTYWQRPGKQPLQLTIEAVSVVDVGQHQIENVRPGTVLSPAAEHQPSATLWVRTGDGILSIGTLRPAGKRSMTTGEFLRGYSIPPGTVFV